MKKLLASVSIALLVLGAIVYNDAYSQALPQSSGTAGAAGAAGASFDGGYDHFTATTSSGAAFTLNTGTTMGSAATNLTVNANDMTLSDGDALTLSDAGVTAKSFTAVATATNAQAVTILNNTRYCLDATCQGYIGEVSNVMNIGLFGANYYSISGASGVMSTPYTFQSNIAAGSTGFLLGVTGQLIGTGGTTLRFNANDITVSSGDTLIATGGLSVGTSGTAITSSFAAASTIDFASTTDSCIDSSGITVTGATVTSTAAVGPPAAAMVANAQYTAWVSAADTVKVRFCAVGVVAVDPASGSFIVRVNNQ